ncbi:MAG: leucine-rich repeat protein [Clostridia bacterium]|nr:leucine-rich repeat protein [Clostridia bacterium]
MKAKVCIIISLLCIILFACFSFAIAYEDASSYISFYNQTRGATYYGYNKEDVGYFSDGYWDKQLKAIYGKEIYHDSSTWRYISNRGCQMLAYANAIQWLTNQKANDTRAVEILYELYSQKSDPTTATSDYTKYIVKQYGTTYGIKEASKSKAWNNIVSVLDNGGCFLLHVTYGGGGHYALVVGYQIASIGGVSTKLLQVVDSSTSSTIKRIPNKIAYSFSNLGSKISGNFSSNSGNYGQYWIRYDDFNSTSADSFSAAFTSVAGKARIQVNPTSMQLSASSGVLYLDSTLSLSANVYPVNANQSITWTTSNSNVATVNNGVVNPAGIGIVTITATSSVDNSIKASCELEVKYNGTGMIKFNSIIIPYRYKINSNGFNWASGSGSITSDVNLKEVFFTLVHPPTNSADPSTAKVYTWRYPSDTSKTIGAKQLDMTTVNSLIKFSAISTTGQGFFEIKAVDIAGRTLTKGRIIQVSKTTGVTASTNSECTNTQYRMTTRIEEPQLKDSAVLNGHRYERYLATYSWTEAKVYAERLGGHLVTINDAEENATVFSLVNKDSDFGAWIGGYRDGSVWKWVTNEPFSYTNWNTDDNEPNGQWSLENYAAMMRTAGKWRDSALNNYAWKYFVVEYDPVLVSEILITGEKAVTVGESFTLSATVLPDNTYNNRVIFSSSDPTIASVDSETGLVTAIKEGEVTIVAIAADESGVSSSFILSVLHEPISVTGVKISADDSLYTDENTIVLRELDTISLNAIIMPTDADNTDCYFTSSDGAIISVEDYSNIITAIGSGTCTITVTTVDGEYTDSITVIVLPISGNCGENLTWSKSGTSLTISGTGAMYDYDNNGGPWGQEITSLILEDGITYIGAKAFYYSQVNTIEWPSTLKTIGRLAFHGCMHLETLNNLPEGLEALEIDAFSNCTNLSSVIFPSSLQTIGGDAFQFTSLQTVSIPSSVRSIGYNPFCCTTIQSIQVQNSDYFKTVDGVLYTKDGKTLVAYPCEDERNSYFVEPGTETIQANAFYGQKYLINLVFPWGVNTISRYACYGINSLQSVTIPGTVTAIGNNALVSCPNLTISCTEGSAAQEYAVANSIPFTLIDSPLINPDFVLPTGTSVIEEEAFMGIAAKRIKLPEGVTEIRANAFANCPNLKQIYIPEGCERIATTAFSGVSYLIIYPEFPG